MHVIDLVHCGLWGPDPGNFTDGYRYYAIFINDVSHFMWFYPLKVKYEFFGVLKNFLALVQTQFYCKMKVFQSDGGSKFISHQVRQLFLKNGTHHGGIFRKYNSRIPTISFYHLKFCPNIFFLHHMFMQGKVDLVKPLHIFDLLAFTKIGLHKALFT